MPAVATASVLVVDDDPAVRKMISAALRSVPHHVLEATTAKEAVAAIKLEKPDVVLLDLGLPDGGGLAVIRQVREWSQVPILVVSGMDGEDDKVAALESGADDYVTKPFGVAELLARVKVVIRRQEAGKSDTVMKHGHVTVNLDARKVLVYEEEVHLTPIEYKLLVVLAKHAGRVVTHRQLLTEVWGPEYEGEAQYLRVYVGYLRKKLKDDPESPRVILNEPRIGYRMID